MKPKTTLEKRSAKFCADVAHYGSASFTVEWIRSATWGRNPRIVHNGEKLAIASGCGYCKESAALTECLQWLGVDDEQRQSIARAHGCGVETVIDRLRRIGWNLSRIASGRSFEAYQISRIEIIKAGAVGPAILQ